MRTLGPLVDRAAAPAARSDAAFDAAASSSVHLGPKAKRAGFGVPEGFVPDPKSGYYYSAESGYYFDASSKLYFHGTTQQWYSSDPITGQAAWFDLKVHIEKTDAPAEAQPEIPPQRSPYRYRCLQNKRSSCFQGGTQGFLRAPGYVF